MKADVIIVGAGPSGIFTALELLRTRSDLRIMMLERGLPVEKRSCPKDRCGRCTECTPCNITTGFSGAGAFSDGKLSLSAEVGGDLPELIGAERAQATIKDVDNIYLGFGADERVEGTGDGEQIREIRLRAIRAGLKMVDCPIRHLGTEKAQELYLAIEHHLMDAGVDIRFKTECLDLVIENSECTGVIARGADGEQRIDARRVIIATGRRGADWLERLCSEHDISHTPGPVDIGVRIEMRNEVIEHVNQVLYEGKLIGYPNPFRNKVRTFCQNPGGFVAQENYDGGLAVVNGHSFKQRKSDNTNLAILCSHNFREPFNQPIAYAQNIGRLCNMLGDGHILVQRFGDVLDGKRTWQKELDRSNVQPTLPDAVAGDITSALPFRTMTSIVAFMVAVDKAIPGFASAETLLYAPELKFYSNRISMDADFTTNVANLHCLGDSSGWTRGLMMASVMGHLMGVRLAAEL
ncbi:FAD dependent oxidoreductase [Coriobacterium glomerans PW2]|uniref:FAD dependent oxidoreductase n=1 Tax=Coriobacterium glomerans (strain ATCC 49209 / DSM 20642 / JCM 10262 / PW2) TaxID=700015 RepID=F2N7E1_CORGP|nr:FAD-binding protein [Coriobacterium glomerans]AEB06616.1 FAD dependent oxidoreductase [Coriobacterium glomerans PW2]